MWSKDNLLLVGSRPGAQAARALCDRLVMLSGDAADVEAIEALWWRKWTRSHWGKRSYRERGVTAEEYAVYWHHYIWPA